MKTPYALAAAALAVVMHLSSILYAQEYEIRLNRPTKVGDKYRLSTTGHDVTRMVVLVGNTPVQQQLEDLSVELVSSITVLEINPRGEILKFALDIEKCVIKLGGIPQPLLPPGSVVIGVGEGNRTVFKMNEAPVDSMAARVLDMVAPFAASDVNDDDIFGTRDRKQVGDTWDINAEVAAKSFKRILNLSTDKEDVKGASTLDAVVKGGNDEYLVISAWLTVGRLSVPLPDGIAIQNGQLKGEFSGRFPTNQALQSPVQSMKLAAWFRRHSISGRQGSRDDNSGSYGAAGHP